MKIYIQSNFVIPGLEERDSLEFDRSEISLKEFLIELSRLAPVKIEYLRDGKVDPDEWEIEVNNKPYYNCDGGLDTLLRDNDTVIIKIMAIGGG